MNSKEMFEYKDTYGFKYRKEVIKYLTNQVETKYFNQDEMIVKREIK